MACGRIRKEVNDGWALLVDNELKNMKMGVLKLKQGQSHSINTNSNEYACVLISGECEIEIEKGVTDKIGPRRNPFEDEPFGIFITREEKVTFTACSNTIIGVAYSPAEKKTKTSIITPDQVGGGKRGVGNWERDVRFVCWSDNTEGNQLIAGETCTPSGNWSTIPPHRHQYDIPGSEVPYEELYFFQFSKPQGYGICWQFDDEGEMDQAFSLKTNDVVFTDKGYHPTVSGPGSILYHLTFIAGPYRISKSSVHKDFKFLLEDNNMENPYAKQIVKK